MSNVKLGGLIADGQTFAKTIRRYVALSICLSWLLPGSDSLHLGVEKMVFNTVRLTSGLVRSGFKETWR